MRPFLIAFEVAAFLIASGALIVPVAGGMALMALAAADEALPAQLDAAPEKGTVALRIEGQSPFPGSANPIGIFENHGDVGTVLHPGSVVFDATTRRYTVAGSGDNMWSTQDAFHYAWKEASGDLALTADISFVARATHRIERPAS